MTCNQNEIFSNWLWSQLFKSCIIIFITTFFDGNAKINFLYTRCQLVPDLHKTILRYLAYLFFFYMLRNEVIVKTI